MSPASCLTAIDCRWSTMKRVLAVADGSRRRPRATVFVAAVDAGRGAEERVVEGDAVARRRGRRSASARCRRASPSRSKTPPTRPAKSMRACPSRRRRCRSAGVAERVGVRGVDGGRRRGSRRRGCRSCRRRRSPSSAGASTSSPTHRRDVVASPRCRCGVCVVGVGRRRRRSAGTFWATSFGPLAIRIEVLRLAVRRRWSPSVGGHDRSGCARGRGTRSCRAR